RKSTWRAAVPTIYWGSTTRESRTVRVRSASRRHRRLGGRRAATRISCWSGGTRREKKPPRQILLVDDAGIIVGLASSGIERPDVAKGPEITDLRTGWQGYAKAGRNVSA